jgi:HlyD family secretion protein
MHNLRERENMHLRVILTIIAIIILGSSITACGLFGEETPEPTVEISAIQQPDVVSAEAFVVPVQDADLAFELNGRIAALTVEEGATSEQLAQAEASLAGTEASLAERLAGPTPEEIGQAEAAVETARANLAQVLAGFRDEEIAAASARLLQAEADVRLAQADYDEFVYGEPDRAEPFGIALQQATLDFEAAQAEYNRLVNGATDEEIAVARAQVNEAQAALAKVQAGATAEQVAQAQAEVARAEAALAELAAGATGEEVAMAEAAVKTAEANVQVSETELAKTRLRAPFDGIIGLLQVDQGEFVQSGAAVLALGDNSRWQIETDDLTEIDVVRVRQGAKVTISVDALPEELFEGTVVRITPKAVTKAGDETYTVLIDITQGDTAPLRWGMTTFVDIEVEPEL